MLVTPPWVTRRTMLAAAAAAAAASPLLTPGLDAAVAAAAVRFFTPSELAMVDELTTAWQRKP